MTTPVGEMPFLDHLEELRSRLIKVLIAVAVGFSVAWWAVIQFNLIVLLKEPIAPYLPEGKLVVLSPMEGFVVTLHLGFVLGLVIASPVVIYQLWAFLSPALFPKEKRAVIPALLIGLVLFLFGVWVAWTVAIPSALKFGMTFQKDAFTPMITFKEYLSLMLQVMLAFGVGFELPLVMILLASLGVMSYRKYVGMGRYAIVVCSLGGAFLSPTPEVTSMVIVTILLLGLYGIGIAGAYLVDRRKRAREAAVGVMVLLALGAAPRELRAQNPPPPPQQTGLPAPAGTDTSKHLPGAAGGVHTLDSATAKRLGLPAAPSAKFPAPDPLMQALIDLPGFTTTRYLADSASLDATDRSVQLHEHAATLRDNATLEAKRITYDAGKCLMSAQGEPRSFEPGKVVVGRQISYNTCDERAIITEAYTSFSEPSMPGNWFVRGNLAVDSSAKRLFAGHSEFTSCDLPDPHYHFTTSELKWVSQSVIVARPVVLYIRDVPVVWLPFIFQDTKAGRRSGILIPQFGINDIVRPTQGYNRQVTNIGYYWAPNDYMDLTTRFDWLSNNYVQYGADFRYRWLDRFILDGSDLGFSEQHYVTGSNSETIHWSHAQQFNIATSLRLNFNYISNSAELQNNSIDPTQVTQSITSSANLTKKLSWGSVTLGADRSQTLGNGPTTMTLPSVVLSPNPVSLGHNSSWSPSLTITNMTQSNTPLPSGPIPVIAGGAFDTLSNPGRSRTSSLSLTTPFDIRGFTIQMNAAATDVQVVGRTSSTLRVPDTSTPDPNDSINVNSVRNGSFSSGVDVNVGISLPSVLRNTWKVTPSINATNITSGPLFLRSDGSNGAWTEQGKKLQLQLAAAPTFFGFINTPIGPAVRTRYSLAPAINFQWSPAASISTAYAQALAGLGGVALPSTVPSTMTASVGLQQVIEMKVRPGAHDTTTDQTKWPNRRILQLSTSALGYDFEQAKLLGRTGWTTQSLTNSIATDLIPGFELQLTHDLWNGTVGTDTARFSPFLTNVSANFSVSGHTFHGLAALLGLAHRDSAPAPPVAPAASMTPSGVAAEGATPMYPTGLVNVGGSGSPLGSRGFNASVIFSMSRTRPNAAPPLPFVTDTGFGLNPIATPPIPALVVPGTQSDLRLNMSFSPTAFWTVSWSTEYDFTLHTFSSQSIQLQRDLHDWRASFDFSKAPNGNFALYFTVFLINLPEIKADYRQTTIQQQ